jgi:helix-hairpin-helix protein
VVQAKSTFPDRLFSLRRIEITMKRALFCIMTLVLLTSIGCTPSQRSPEAIRQDTAKATTEATKDAKAVVKGVEDALKNKSSDSVDINEATPDQLRALPGITAVQAHRIVAGRPYTSTDQLVKRRIVSKAEYDKISGQVVAD